ncbi:MAG: UDP-N-acetylglucosamine 2-epimerase (non-hydrolyzing) [Chloroflexi bacterium]|nr:UDP-N-acetylglucosamine 2-epimerase (non-hydrolyzing) [Chloroflexota bacterium]
MKVLTVVGARPQFIKAAPVCKALRARGHEDVLIHTGQHYDANMSQVFFDELQIPRPHLNLGIGSGAHGWQTAQMLMQLEQVMLRESPDWVLVYGDTNSTLAAALAAVKLRFPIAHVEAGLRSFNRDMPEEHNRVLTDHCADLLFCPTQTAVENLRTEGIRSGVHWVGDTMYDALLFFLQRARGRSTILDDLALSPKSYMLATVHRPYNTDVRENLHAILTALAEIEEKVVFPVHPRTRSKMLEFDMDIHALQARGVHFIEPVSYFDMLILEENAKAILTDSGGVQKEAFFLSVPCITLRPETEWVETVEAGWNVVVGADRDKILHAANSLRVTGAPPLIFGDGRAAEKIVDILEASQP